MRQQVEILHCGFEKGLQQKTVLQTQYEELQVTFTRSQEMLPGEKDKNELLREELKGISLSHNEVCRW